MPTALSCLVGLCPLLWFYPYAKESILGTTPDFTPVGSFMLLPAPQLWWVMHLVNVCCWAGAFTILFQEVYCMSLCESMWFTSLCADYDCMETHTAPTSSGRHIKFQCRSLDEFVTTRFAQSVLTTLRPRLNRRKFPGPIGRRNWRDRWIKGCTSTINA